MKDLNERALGGRLQGAGSISICKACGAPIRFLESPKTHKLNPIDVEPVASGNLRIDEEHGLYLFILDRAEVPETERYVSHFATCPRAGEFRHA
jgi:hypothetical protein